MYIVFSDTSWLFEVDRPHWLESHDALPCDFQTCTVDAVAYYQLRNHNGERIGRLMQFCYPHLEAMKEATSEAGNRYFDVD
jgi:hypothetical protein